MTNSSTEYPDDERIYMCYLHRDRAVEDVAHLITDKYLTEIPSGSIETAYRFACGDEYIGYHVGAYNAGRYSQNELNALDVPICQGCLGLELYSAPNPQHLSLPRIWIPNIEQELLEYFRLHPTAMYDMHPRKFEELIAAIFRNQGFYVELTPETRDGGFDAIAIQSDHFTGTQSYVVECKRNAPTWKVGIGVVRSIYGVLNDRNATKAIVVTTSSYTEGAKRFGDRHLARLSLRDYNDVVAWLNLRHPRLK